MTTVTCAIIHQDNKVLCAQRSSEMQHPLKWEFPGGKVEEEETLEECLRREIKEELNIDIKVKTPLIPRQHQFGEGKEIILHPFYCTIEKGKPKAHEHKEIKWVPAKDLKELDWVEADLAIMDEVIKTLKAG